MGHAMFLEEDHMALRNAVVQFFRGRLIDADNESLDRTLIFSPSDCLRFFLAEQNAKANYRHP